MTSTNGTSSKLKCGIIGAGIAGLGAAISLAEAGLDVEVFEKSSFKNEVGAAVSCQPNSIYILDRWGFDWEKAQPTPCLSLRSLDNKTLKATREMDLSDTKERYGYDIRNLHRVDLHNGLKDLAEQKARIRLGEPVADIDPEKATITLKSGEVIQKDLVVVACGIHNPWLQRVTGKDVANHTAGMVYRMLIPMEKILAIPDAKAIYDQPPGFLEAGFRAEGGPGTDAVGIFSYPCRSGKLLNLAAARRHKAQVQADEWHIDATKEEALAIYEGSHPVWTAIIDQADEVKQHPATFREPAPRMNFGKVILIGDASHAMMPTLGQGANQALEDAAAFHELFKDASAADVESRLDLFNTIRWPRSSAVQTISNEMFGAVTKEIREKVAKFVPTAPMYPWDGWHFTTPSRNFLYNYDIYDQTRKALEASRKGEDPASVLKFFNESGEE